MSTFQLVLNRVRAWIKTHPLQTIIIVCMLFAAWFGYQGQDIYRQNATERAVLLRRDEAVQVAAPIVKDLIHRMHAAETQALPYLRAGQAQSVIQVFSKNIKGVEKVELYPVDLDAAYKNIETFGYGKLALLESAANDEYLAIRVIKIAGSPKLVLAKAIGDIPKQLVLVQLPITYLNAVLESDIPGDAYLALRQDQLDILKMGDENLASTAELNARNVDQTPWRVVVSAPLPERGLFEAQGLAEFVIMVLFLLAALLCWFGPRYLEKRRRANGESSIDSNELTLQQMYEQGALTSDAVREKPIFDIKEKTPNKVQLERSIFRAYDIRGIVDENLNVEIARLIGQVVGSILLEKSLAGIIVGYDGRLSSLELANGLIEGISSTGVNVINIGQVPTPLVYFACCNSAYNSGIALTGSHNPANYNGFKIVIDGHTLSGDAISNIYERIVEKKIIQAKDPGHVMQKDFKSEYINYIAHDIQLDRPLKVAVDCGNGVPGDFVPELLSAIGAHVEPIYCEVDGNFPNHHPDPSEPENLRDLIEIVKRTGADIGLAFDGDGDRLGVVSAQGVLIYPDRLLMLFAEDVLQRNPGAAIIYDVKCTAALQGHILRYGGSPMMWKTGHSLIKAKMKETHAELAGEMSGHFFFAERWFGFDDGMYAAARLLEILAMAPDGLKAVFDKLPASESTPELKIHLSEGEPYRFIEQFASKAKFDGARITAIDGVRADWPEGWGLVRASNTTPVLVLRFEADSKEHLHVVQERFREQLLAVRADLNLPF